MKAEPAKSTDETFGGYLNRERVEAAAALIKSGTPATKAAMDLGFAEFSTFWRNFKKYLGVSPRDCKY